MAQTLDERLQARTRDNGGLDITTLTVSGEQARAALIKRIQGANEETLQRFLWVATRAYPGVFSYRVHNKATLPADRDDGQTLMDVIDQIIAERMVCVHDGEEND